MSDFSLIHNLLKELAVSDFSLIHNLFMLSGCGRHQEIAMAFGHSFHTYYILSFYKRKHNLKFFIRNSSFGLLEMLMEKYFDVLANLSFVNDFSGGSYDTRMSIANINSRTEISMKWKRAPNFSICVRMEWMKIWSLVHNNNIWHPLQ